jgi:hypothetical protein
VNRVTTAAIKEGAQVAVKDAVKMMMEELQPFLAREKVEQVFRSVARAKAHQERIDRVSEATIATDKDGNPLLDSNGDPIAVVIGPKDVGYLVSAEDKLDMILRRDVGMSDGASVGGALNVNILTQQASIGIAPTHQPEATAAA